MASHLLLPKIVDMPSTGIVMYDWIAWVIVILVLGLLAMGGIILRLAMSDVSNRFKSTNAKVEELDIAVGVCQTSLSELGRKLTKIEAYETQHGEQLKRIEENQNGVLRSCMENQAKMADALLAAITK